MYVVQSRSYFRRNRSSENINDFDLSTSTVDYSMKVIDIYIRNNFLHILKIATPPPIVRGPRKALVPRAPSNLNSGLDERYMKFYRAKTIACLTVNYG